MVLTLTWMVRTFSDFESNIVSVERVNEYCDLPHEADWESASNKPEMSWPSKGGIKFKNYSVKYRENMDFALKNITCEIEAGEKVNFRIFNS